MMNVYRLINPRCRFASLQTPSLYAYHNKTEGLKAPGYLNPRLSDVFRSTFNVHRFDKRLCRRHLYMLHNKTEGLKAPGYSNPRLSGVFRSTFNVHRFNKRLCRRHHQIIRTVYLGYSLIISFRRCSLQAVRARLRKAPQADCSPWTLSSLRRVVPPGPLPVCPAPSSPCLRLLPQSFHGRQ